MFHSLIQIADTQVRRRIVDERLYHLADECVRRALVERERHGRALVRTGEVNEGDVDALRRDGQLHRDVEDDLEELK